MKQYSRVTVIIFTVLGLSAGIFVGIGISVFSVKARLSRAVKSYFANDIDYGTRMKQQQARVFKRVEKIFKRRYALNDEQINKISEVFENHRGEIINLREDFRKNMLDLFDKMYIEVKPELSKKQIEKFTKDFKRFKYTEEK